MARFVEAALSFERPRIAGAIEAAVPVMEESGACLAAWAKAVETGADWSRKGIAAEDAAVMVLSADQAARALVALSEAVGPATGGGLALSRAGAVISRAAASSGAVDPAR